MKLGKNSLLFVAVAAVVGCGSAVSEPEFDGSTETELIPVSTKGMHSVTPPSPLRLPLSTVFKGESKFRALVAKAERENWRQLPLGQRTVRAARAMVGTPYVNYTLEIDDRIENPVVNFGGMDCWTYYENALAFARMLRYKPAPYKPQDMLHMVEIERYRGGRCTGGYLSRMHHLEEVFYDNQKRGLATNVTPKIPGAVRLRREIREMTVQWKSYRYLRNNRSLVPEIGKIEAQVSKLPVYHIPKSKVRKAESYLQDGDVCAITSNWKYGYTSHVGLIVKLKGRAYFTHATSDRDKGRMTIIDRPITDYLNASSKHAGIAVLRPKDLPPSPMWQRGVVGR
ncbi:N-acetylmuramoyl-L-alanine amidase-like domain-containing protein [Haloferula sp.]|uniref:N-acetylmuramoyl-L-alanine amidase-like domain-containing protein n=1 Tax=Haloferula sp. TaxID=2497595 RepID=UPI00329D966C